MYTCINIYVYFAFMVIPTVRSLLYDASVFFIHFELTTDSRSTEKLYCYSPF